MADEPKSTQDPAGAAAAHEESARAQTDAPEADARRSGAELVAVFQHLGASGLEIELDRRWEPPRLDFDATPSPPPSDY